MISHFITELLGYEDEEESEAFFEYLRSVIDPDSPYFVPHDRIQILEKEKEKQQDNV